MGVSRKVIQVSAVLLLAVAGCVPQTLQRRANVLDYLYPGGKVQAAGGEVKLQLPLRVGISFAPSSNNAYDRTMFSEPQQRELLRKVAAAFRGTSDVGLVEILRGGLGEGVIGLTLRHHAHHPTRALFLSVSNVSRI